MRKLLWAGLISISATSLTWAEKPEESRDVRRDLSPAMTSTTPEMWFYEQERARYEDPKQSVRRNAEFRATQRASRLASLKWYGMSNSRPVVSPMPQMGTSYSPCWRSSNPDPYRWTTGGGVYVVQRPVYVQ